MKTSAKHPYTDCTIVASLHRKFIIVRNIALTSLLKALNMHVDEFVCEDMAG